MKRIHLNTLSIIFFIITTAVLVSCSSDNEITNFNNPDIISVNRVTNLPKNDANPYDEVGVLYDELFDTYYVNGNLGGTVSQIANKVQTIADANATFNSINLLPYQNVSTTRVNYLVEHPATCINDVITASSMSVAGRSSLTNFINSFLVFLKTESNCDVIYEKVLSYENEVLQDTILSQNDKRIILSTTSVTRFLTYRATRKPKKNTDPDWTVLIGNIVAATEGAENGSAESAVMALVTGIVQND